MSAARAKDVFHVKLDVLKPTSCGGCGLCCLGIGSPPIYYATYPHLQGPHPFRPADLPQHLIDEIDEKFLGVFRGQEPPDTCIWHDTTTGLCRNYEWRPQVCRDYDLGGRECLSLRQTRLTADAAAKAAREGRPSDFVPYGLPS